MSNTPSLQALYPHLGAAKRDPATLNAALLESVRSKAGESRDANTRFFEDQGAALVAAAQALAGVWRAGGKLFAMGNGGSSCDASHFTVEFLHPITAGRPALPAVNLGADLAMISAVGNDVGFDQIFARQVIAQAASGDGLIGFSTSGASANLIAAFEVAKQRGLVTFGLAGGDGGRMKTCGLVDHCLVVETSSIHRIQECHVTAYHILWDLVHTILSDTRGGLTPGSRA
ncbi:SIS domain-containing protein [Phenylobacterium sp.]|jgi:D-sedoheptulose 7-phosphate isomerase|uniref:D-sedoheptulose-7-phosphate isomerase n=1 Tax=Phenylobacterium sp. TaxID=1871053 RepID=UPI002E360F23|nr:SIS domain-containing protein [Phenylobacterium sp.]HEX4711180.1 SIS domain-containing protein [Phenylobacterium sp.]